MIRLLNMLYRFLCCFRRRNFIPFLVENSFTNIESNIQENTRIRINSEEDICVRIHPEGSLMTWKDTIKFVPPIENGFVIKVYDGDTITIASKLPYNDSPMYRFSVRLNGIDCPEIKGKDENEKQCAQIAKNLMTELVLNKIVTLKNINTEKYGRILADVYIGDLNVNEHMIEKRLAVSYDGGTKNSPNNWMNYYCKGELLL